MIEALPLWALAAVFAVGAATVWAAGTRLAGYATAIAERTGLSGAVIGVVLLGLITSLPEVATAGTAALGGNADLAVNNLLGGVAFQIMVIAAADMALRRRAITSTLPTPAVMLQAVLCIAILTVALAGTIVGDTAVLGIGLWSGGLVILYVLGMLLLHRAGSDRSWVPPPGRFSKTREAGAEAGPAQAIGNGALALRTGAAALAILAAGYVLTRTAEAIAVETGVGSQMIGLVLLAFATSLPELSSAIAAVRLRQPGMAMGDVFGGNITDVALIALVDAFYGGPPVLNSVNAFSSLAALLGILLTAIYLVGMLRRQDRQVGRLGYDSIAVIATYAAGLALLWSVAA
ncbi:MAG: sodium:calcium antiporter [Allosphingosinicella sp.]|uniref:sodium:calcium antiporter n=1 Tax=Allosphingosinicella sp. TaxID=2823234 RepID=UPI003927C63C